MQPDTLIPNPSNPQSWNRYSYVSNNPVNFNDPTGHAQEDDDYSCHGCTQTSEPSSSGGSDGNPDDELNKDDDKPPSCPIHQAFCVGWDWLTEQGGGSSNDDPMVFGPDDQMTQDFMNSEGVQQAWQEFLDGGEVDSYKAVEVNFEAYYKGFIDRNLCGRSHRICHK